MPQELDLQGTESRSHPLADTLTSLWLGMPRDFGGLTVLPLLNPAALEATYVTLREGIATRTVRVTESSESGTVHELRVANTGSLPVFILDGEELVGAKQNRMVNLSVMIAAGRETLLPVSCVEQGRWRYRSREFTDSPNTMYAFARSAKTARVSDAMKRGLRDADQMAVWREVAAKAANLNAGSSTGALKDVFDQHDRTLADYDRVFMPEPGQTGALFALGGSVVGLDVFDAQTTLKKYLPKLVRGYALDAMEQGSAGLREQSVKRLSADADQFLDALSRARTRRYPGVGIGIDVRLDSPGIAGGALFVDNHAVHVSAFRSETATRRRSAHRYSA